MARGRHRRVGRRRRASDWRGRQRHPHRSRAAACSVPLDGHSRWPQARRDFAAGGSAPGEGGPRPRLCGKPRAYRRRAAGAVVMSADHIMSTSLIPVSVLTGFLGSGKTTMLRHLLGQPEFSRTAVIINEFGEVGLDHELIEASEDSVVELQTGCLCCKIRTDLAQTLQDLLRRRDEGRCPPFNRIVIETSGLADPAPILQTLMTDTNIACRLVLGSVVMTVDAVNGAGTLEREGVSQKQVAVADRMVLTKLDLAAPAEPALLRCLEELNAGAPVFMADHGRIDSPLVFNSGLYDPQTKSNDARAWLAEEAHGHS